jgi:hypothetical protein
MTTQVFIPVLTFLKIIIKIFFENFTEHRYQSDQRPPSACSFRRLQEHQVVVRQGEEDQGHLSHPQPLQPGRDPQVSDSRVLDPDRRSVVDSNGSEEGLGQEWLFGRTSPQSDGDARIAADFLPDQQIYICLPGLKRFEIRLYIPVVRLALVSFIRKNGNYK